MTTNTALSPAKQLAQNIQRMSPNFKQALPPNVDPDRFTRVVMNAVQNDPKLLEADRTSLFNACNRAAQDGLLPDGREGKIVVFKTKVNDKWIQVAQWMPMVGGLRKLAAKHGFQIDAQVVFQFDEFLQQQGDDPKIVHNPPPLGQPRGEMIGVYAIATNHATGEKYREVMDKTAIDKVRAASKSGEFGPWKDWYDEMARKTIVKRIYKALPIPFDEYDAGVIQRDNEQDYAFNNEAEAPVADVEVKKPSVIKRLIESDQTETVIDDNDVPFGDPL